MDFLKKLDYLMNKYELTKTTLSQKSGIPYTTIDAWYKKGYEGLKLTTLRKLALYFNTSLDYLMLDEITDPNYGKSNGFQIDYNEMEHLIKPYRDLDDHGRESINIILEREAERAKLIAEKEQTISDLQKRLSSYKGRFAVLQQEDKSHLEPQAAHARTDVETTEAMKQYDDDLMDNDDFWK